MKSLFTLPILFCSFVLFAQEAQLDSFHQLIYLDDDWSLETTYIFEYPADDALDRYSYSVDENGVRTPSFYFSWTYNANGDVAEILYHTYVEQIKDYQIYARRDYTYDDDNNLSGVYSFDWDSAGEDWENDLAFEYERYTEQGDYQLRKYLQGINGIDWEVSSEITQEHFYNAENLLDSTIRKQESIISFTYKFLYDSEGREIEYRNYTNGGLELNANNFRSYNSEGLVSEILFNYYDSTVDAVLADRKRIFEYDSNMDLVCRIDSEFDVEYIDTDKFLYFPRVMSSVNSLLDLGLKVNWTNVGFGKLDISMEGLDASQNYKVALFNMQGEPIKFLTLKNQASWNNSYRLDSGAYVLIVRDDENRMHSEKMVVVR